MYDIAFMDSISLSVYIATLAILLTRWKMALQSDVKTILIGIISLGIFQSLSNFLEWSDITASLDGIEDYLEVLIPLLWCMFFYVYLQGLFADDIRKSETRYELAATSGQVAVWEWNLKTGEFSPDPNLKAMLDYGERDLPNTLDVWLGLLHPQDLEVFNRNKEPLLSGQITQFESEIRLKHKSGCYRWFLFRGASLEDRTNKTIRLFGTAIDTTDRRNTEEKMKQALMEKDVLLKEVHHRVKNNLQIVSSLLDLQFGKFQDKGTQEVIHRTQERIKAISFAHEMLYRSRQLAAIDYADYVGKLTMFLFNLSSTDNNRVRIINKVRSVWLDLNSAILCGLIINELVTNSLKHAFDLKGDGEIAIEFWEDAGRYFLKVSDTGKAAKKDLNDPGTHSLGLQLVSRFVQQLNGRFSFGYEQGVVFAMDFPKAPAVTFVQ
jgi:PAS domain S-box-containing protein